MFLLESPHRGDSNEFTQYTNFNIKKTITLNYPKSAAMGFFSKGLKNEFETAMVNEPSVFEPLKFSCIYKYTAAMGFFSKGLKNDFETAMVNVPSVFEPLKFSCIYKYMYTVLYFPQHRFHQLEVNINVCL